MGLRAILLLVFTFATIPLSLAKPFYGLLLYAFFQYSRPQELTWGKLNSLRLSLVCGIALILGAVLNREKLFAQNWRVVLVVLFWCFGLFSLFFSKPNPYQLSQFDFFTKTIVIVILMTGLINTSKKFYFFCLSITGFIAVYSARQGYMGIVSSPLNLGGHINDNNYYAVWLCVVFPFAYYLIRTAHKKWIKLFFVSMLPGMFLALVWTYSRGGYLGIVAVAFYLIVRSRHKMRNFVLGAICGILIFSVMPQTVKEEAASIQTAQERQERSSMSRIHYWKVALNMAGQHPIFGVGFSGSEANYDKYDFLNGFYGRQRSIHETFLQVLAENGIFAFLVFISLIISTFFINFFVRQQVKVWALKEKTNLIQWSYMVECALVGFSTCGLFCSAGYLDILWYVLSLSIAFEEIVKSEIRKKQKVYLAA